MKEAIIKHEFDHSYALFQKEGTEEGFHGQMILQNAIPGFLPCKLRYIDENVYYGYDISSKRSLSDEYKDRKIGFDELRELFYGIQRIMKAGNEFLLAREGFLLKPEYVFKDLETEELFCLYLPSLVQCENEDGSGGYREFADFLLDKTDHKDEHAVNVVYQFYKMSKEAFFSFDVFVGFMEKESLLVRAKEKRKTENKNVEKQDMEKEYVPEDEYMVDFSKEEKKRAVKWQVPAVFFGLGTLLAVSYLMVPALKAYALYILVPGAGLMGMAVIMTIHMICQILRNREEEAWEEPQEPVRVEEYFDDLMDSETVFFDEEPFVCLKWKEGHFSKEHLLKELPVTVGKMKDSVQICIDDPSVSRLHARFKEQKEGIFVQDLDSTNGTFVNGKRLVAGQEVHIKRNDEIQFGKIIVNVV